MDYKNSVVELIGNTPLLKLNKVIGNTKGLVLAKLENMNPGGSVKDRIGIKMIEAAERDGKISPGGLIIEPTSGNTGIGVALAAIQRGYRCLFVMTDKASVERVRYLKAMGAEILIVSSAAKASSPEYYFNTAQRLAKEIPNAFMLNQYDNPANPDAHYTTTAKEIWEQTDGRLTHFIAGVGTGGTITGNAKFFKEKNNNIKVYCADPTGSMLKTYKETGRVVEALPYMIEGVGQERIPGNLDFNFVDEVINVNDKEAFNMARRLAREESIFCGGSSGMNIAVAAKKAKELKEGDVMVAIICDTGERYLSKHHSDEWLSEKGFLSEDTTTVGTLLQIKRSNLSLISVSSNTPIREVLAIMDEKGFSQLPVIDGGQPVGSVRDNRLMSLLLEDRELINKPVKDVMEPSFLVIKHTLEVADAAKFLREHRALLVEDYGRISGIITRHDVI